MAKLAGIRNANNYIDATTLTNDASINDAVLKYSVFGRVTPEQKRKLVRALKKMSIETGGIICLGCGHEHGCGVHGCAVLKEAAKRILRAGKTDEEE